MHRFKESEVWKKAMDLSQKNLCTYQRFPFRRKIWTYLKNAKMLGFDCIKYGRRNGKDTNGEFKQFLGIAQGSAFEPETQILLAGKMKFLEEKNVESISSEITSISNMIFKLEAKLKTGFVIRNRNEGIKHNKTGTYVERGIAPLW